MPAVPFSSIYPDGPNSQAAGGPLPAAGGAGDSNALWPGMPLGATPFSRDLAVLGPGTFVIWSPAPGRKFVLTNAILSADGASRVAIVDGNDQQGARPVDLFLGANGGATPNLTPVPYPSQNADNQLKLVVAAAVNVKVAVRGWEQ